MLTPGRRFNHQQLADILDLQSIEFGVQRVLRGGMASVAMVQSDNGRVYALKFLDLENTDSEAMERFRREVQIWVTASSCQAVVKVLGTLRIDEAPVVCAEWMSGGDLSRLMSSVEPGIFYPAFDRIIAGLEWVHETYKIIHRDLKPSNILLNDKGEVFVSDWGIGKVAFEAEKLREAIALSKDHPAGFLGSLTRTGQVVGTVHYCSPEQILSSAEVDFRSDIYSLGCLMFEWEVGIPPFLDAEWAEIARMHLDSPPPRISDASRKSKFGADSVIYRCLQKRPDQRFKSYQDLRIALREQAARQGIRYELAQVGGCKKPLVGYGEISDIKLASKGSTGWGLIDFTEAEGYIAEAEVLMSLLEWQKAYDILFRFWVPDFYPDGQMINVVLAVNLAQCLTHLSRSNEAIYVLGTIPDSQRAAEVFVNWSNALNHLALFLKAESIAAEGLARYPDDSDLLGNLTIALTGQGKHQPALLFAKKRLAIERNVHSLEEIARVLVSIGIELFHLDYPKAIEHLSSAVEVLTEANALNPHYAVVRLRLAETLFSMTFYGEAQEVADKLPNGPVWGLAKVVLHAECLNRVSAASECLEFCAKWEKYFPGEPRLLRVEFETIADFYFVGQHTTEGRKVIVPECVEFFAAIVTNEEKRQITDFAYSARIEEWLEAPERAMSFAKQAHSIYGDRWEVYFRYADLMARAGDWQLAYQNLKTACELAPWHPPVWRLRRWIETELGLIEAALSSERHEQDLQVQRKNVEDAARKRLRYVAMD
jgi:tetratricopeptide (TPR) repeat protein